MGWWGEARGAAGRTGNRALVVSAFIEGRGRGGVCRQARVSAGERVLGCSVDWYAVYVSHFPKKAVFLGGKHFWVSFLPTVTLRVTNRHHFGHSGVFHRISNS